MARKQKDKDFDQIMLGPVKAIPVGFTVWDKIIVNGSLTIQEFLNYMKTTYNLVVMIITIYDITIIQTYMPSAKNVLGRSIEEVFFEKGKNKFCTEVPYLVLDISAEYDGITALTPKVQYNLKQ